VQRARIRAPRGRPALRESGGAIVSCLVAGKHGPLNLHESRPYGTIIQPVGEVLLLNQDEESLLEPMLVSNGNIRQVGLGSPDFRPPSGAQERPIKGM